MAKKSALTRVNTASYAQILASSTAPPPPASTTPFRASPKEITATLWPSINSDIYKDKGAPPKEVVRIITENLRVPLAAAHRLPLGDIKAFFFKEEDKAKALSLPSSTLLKIKARFLQEDYLVEVLAVPASLQIQHGKEADNQEIIQQIEDDNRQWNPTIRISRISRIHGERSLVPKLGQQVVRSTSTIVYLKSQESQKAVILHSLVINGRKYATQIYN